MLALIIVVVLLTRTFAVLPTYNCWFLVRSFAGVNMTFFFRLFSSQCNELPFVFLFFPFCIVLFS